MARHTRIKIAALATAFVATLGLAAVGPAVGADAGKTTVVKMRAGGGDSYCC